MIATPPPGSSSALPLCTQWPRLKLLRRCQNRMRNSTGITKNALPGIAVPGFAACVTTALRSVVTQARRFNTTYQPSEHLARISPVRRPRASTRFRVVNNPLHSLRNSPACWLRGRLPRYTSRAMIDQFLGRTAALSRSRRSNVTASLMQKGRTRPKPAGCSWFNFDFFERQFSVIVQHDYLVRTTSDSFIPRRITNRE